MTYADIMRNNRNNKQSCYLQYNDLRQKKPHAFIAFFEGYDAPYYLPIIEYLLGVEAEQIICGNKKNVIAVHDSIFEKKNIQKSKTGFFIDRDYDDNTTIQNRADYFLTRGYSVENYYCTHNAFERILKSYMHYNSAHKDYDSIVSNYKNLQQEYNEACSDFNGWYCCIKRNKLKVDWSLDEKMPNGYIKLELDNFSIVKDYTIKKIHNDFNANPQPSKEEIRRWSSWIMEDPVFNVRGKFEFAFLIAFLSSLSIIVNNPASAFESHNMNFSMGQKDALSALAQYADRDDDLFDYIKKRAS